MSKSYVDSNFLRQCQQKFCKNVALFSSTRSLLKVVNSILNWYFVMMNDHSFDVLSEEINDCFCKNYGNCRHDLGGDDFALETCTIIYKVLFENILMSLPKVRNFLWK